MYQINTSPTSHKSHYASKASSITHTHSQLARYLQLYGTKFWRENKPRKSTS